MYNLLVTAEPGAWDGNSYSYDFSRFLEYTKEEVSQKFKNLTYADIEEIKSFPCIFAYEGETENIRIGRIKSINRQGSQYRTLFFEFEFYADIPPIPFTSIKDATELLDIRKWEMNRTHWAVKDKPLLEILNIIGIIENRPVTPVAVPPMHAPVRNDEPQIKTVKEFIDKVITGEKNNDFEIFYRGHSNKEKYKLEPSLFRRDKDGNYLYLESEDILYRELIVSNSADFSSDEYTLDKLVKMQHYSLPTRLLDITSNPLIALYFACKANPEEEGEVISFSLNRNFIKYFDSDTVSCIANLVRLPKHEKDCINILSDKAMFNEQLPIKRLVHFIREEKSFFEEKIEPEDLRKILCVKSKKSDHRISSQSGAFLLFGLDTVLQETGTPNIRVSRLTISNKENILRELDLLNINESTVFPYIENSARYIAEKYKFDAQKSDINNS